MYNNSFDNFVNSKYFTFTIAVWLIIFLCKYVFLVLYSIMRQPWINIFITLWIWNFRWRECFFFFIWAIKTESLLEKCLFEIKLDFLIYLVFLLLDRFGDVILSNSDLNITLKINIFLHLCVSFQEFIWKVWYLFWRMKIQNFKNLDW